MLGCGSRHKSMSDGEPRKKQLEDLSRARASLVTLGAALIVLVVGLGLRIMANEWVWMKDNHTSIAALARELL